MHSTFFKRDRHLKWECRIGRITISRHTKRKYAIMAMINYIKKHKPHIAQELYPLQAYKYSNPSFRDEELQMVDKLWLGKFKFVYCPNEWVLGRWIK